LVGFWIRRQALEAAVHRWDAESALGEPAGLSPELAAVGIDEVVEELFPRQVSMGRSPELPAQLTLEASDLGRGWSLEASSSEHDPPGEVKVWGTCSDLLLLLWQRRTFRHPALRFEGSPEVMARLDEVRFTP
jgi:uncharacterized protein (TIGR03083 family)